SRGMLSFFYTLDALYEDDEDFYSDPSTCQVIYTSAEDMERLHRKRIPAEQTPEASLRPNRISFTPQLCVPTSESAYLENMGLGFDATLNQQAHRAYWSVFLEKLREQCQFGEYIHRLLGHPDQIQGDMQVHC